MQLALHDRLLNLDRPQIMGIVNVTPDSFSDGGEHATADSAVAHALKLLYEGATILDIGGESTRPGASCVSEAEELSRVLPVVKALAKLPEKPVISVDTSRPQIMRECVKAGAHLINDVRALTFPGALSAALELNVPVILMHMQGTPATMQERPSYTSVVDEVEAFLKARSAALTERGFKEENILWDVGFGFGKSVTDNYALLKALRRFTQGPHPYVGALSRKSMLGAVTGIEKPSERVISSVTGAILCAERGAKILRVHDVKATAEALCVLNAMESAPC
ncbi:MAG TPA: dihydropteroate synthase [Candidatus Avisuccinivibrio pullicola]|nr:dihydropteroate synthase [Candidatus Avisuccinivibrio pullicola]